MTFVVRGSIAGEPVELTWAAGALTGTPAGVEAVHQTVDVGETLYATPTGPALTPNLEQPLAALLTIRASLGRVDEATGDVPTVESIPGRIY